MKLGVTSGVCLVLDCLQLFKLNAGPVHTLIIMLQLIRKRISMQMFAHANQLTFVELVSS